MKAASGKRRFFRDNGLSLVLGALFAISLIGQSIAGHRTYADEQREHRETPVGYMAYLTSSHFAEATFENWESEFLQMAMYVWLTVFLFQRGSAESNDPDEPEPRSNSRARAAHASSRGQRIRRFCYEHSLSLTFASLFLLSFALHAEFGAMLFNSEQLAHGQPQVSVASYLLTSRFWHESFQNWQSEFLSILAMVVLSIFLREKASPESKDVDAPHGQTGT